MKERFEEILAGFEKIGEIAIDLRNKIDGMLKELPQDDPLKEQLQMLRNVLTV